ncbi:hypothetical protein BV20DRAFT_37713 [Pilatotrama ljubarskyi]|nr:hypothetical protein BV20DRAFT_37713 [Pilatotrama ljubarskyi]
MGTDTLSDKVECAGSANVPGRLSPLLHRVGRLPQELRRSRRESTSENFWGRIPDRYLELHRAWACHPAGRLLRPSRTPFPPIVRPSVITDAVERTDLCVSAGASQERSMGVRSRILAFADMRPRWHLLTTSNTAIGELEGRKDKNSLGNEPSCRFARCIRPYPPSTSSSVRRRSVSRLPVRFRKA